MRRRRFASRPKTSLALSFIDTISGGFGAAFFLFLIFATMPLAASSRPGGASRFLEFWLEWDGSAKALGEIGLTLDNGRVLALTSNRFKVNPHTGELTPIDKAAMPWAAAHANGFSWFGEVQMHSADAGRQGVRVRLSDPCPGNWKVTMSLHSREEGGVWFSATTPVKVDAEARVFDGIDRYQQFIADATVELGFPSTLEWSPKPADATAPAAEAATPKVAEILVKRPPVPHVGAVTCPSSP